MKNLSMEVEVLPGTSFDKACKEANELCKQLNIAYIKFNFNGVKVSVGQKMSVTSEELCDLLHKELKEEKGKRYLVINS